jgi:hypothetical protein
MNSKTTDNNLAKVGVEGSNPFARSNHSSIYINGLPRDPAPRAALLFGFNEPIAGRSGVRGERVDCTLCEQEAGDLGSAPAAFTITQHMSWAAIAAGYLAFVLFLPVAIIAWLICGAPVNDPGDEKGPKPTDADRTLDDEWWDAIA